MPATLDNIKDRDLPPAWKRKAKVRDDDMVSVTITPQRPALTRNQGKIDRALISAQARVIRANLAEPLSANDHGNLLYDEYGLPK